MRDVREEDACVVGIGRLPVAFTRAIRVVDIGLGIKNNVTER